MPRKQAQEVQNQHSKTEEPSSASVATTDSGKTHGTNGNRLSPPVNGDSSPSSPSPSPSSRPPRKFSSPSHFFQRVFSSSNRGSIGATTQELDGTQPAQPSRKVSSLYGIATITVLLSVITLALHLLSGLGLDWLPAEYSPVLSVIALIGSAVSVPLAHGLAVHEANDYHFFQPFTGGYRYVLLQFLAWALYSLVLIGAAYILIYGGKQVVFAVVASVGVGGVVAQILVLASVHFFTAVSAYEQEQEEQEAAEKVSRVTRVPSAALPVKGAAPSDEPQVIAALSTGSGKAGMFVTVVGIILAVIIESINRRLSPASHLSLQSILTSALLLGVPLTHIYTGRRIHPAYTLFMPLQGGRVFVLLQALGWTLWVLAVGFSLVSIYFAVHDTHIIGVIGFAGIGGVLSQAMVLLSLKYFDSQLTGTVSAAGRTMDTARMIHASHQRDAEPVSAGETKQAIAEGDVDVRRLIRVASHQDNAAAIDLDKTQLIAAVQWTDNESTETAAAVTQLKQQLTQSRRFTASSWRLSQYAQQELLRRGIHNLPLAPEMKSTPGSSSLISLSAAQWKDGLAILRTKFCLTSMQELALDVRSTLVVAGMYFIPILGASISFLPVIIVYFFHHIWWVALCSALVVIAYMYTLRGRPAFTGSKSWDFIRKNDTLWTSFEHYFKANVIAVGKIDVEKGPFIVGFHPHGIYPLTAFWATRGPSFRAAYPGLEIDVCGASVMFSAPLLREILLWSGGREVSAASIRHALYQHRSILIIPGGQREMLHCSADHQTLVYVTKHKGFIRMAIQTGTPLLPILSLGETFGLQNIKLPRIQRWSLRHTGVGWPVLPYGRWYSPVANPCPITVVVGHPMEVTKIAEPTEAQVDAVHTFYYEAVRKLFEEYKAEAGFPNQKLVFAED